MNDTQRQSFQGWTASPNYRGTIDILSNSCITLVLCSWTVLCLNVVPSTWGRWKQNWRKLLMAILTFAGPEFTFQTAIGQWCSACRSVTQFRRSGYAGWSMRHAFLADMGGFVLQPRISKLGTATEDWTPFPLDAEQLHYLVANNYIPYSTIGPPGLKVEDIKDRNKSDGLARLITILQILWFLVGAVGRAFQHLDITVLELETIAFIVVTLGTAFFWRHKCVDFGRPVVIRPEKATLQEILIDAGEQAQQCYRKTPLDFVGMKHWSWDIYFNYWIGVPRKILGINFHPRARPIKKIPDDYFPIMNKTSMVILFFFQTGYASVHIGGWNFPFPTEIERKLWHVATLGIISAMMTYWVVHFYAYAIPEILRERQGEPPVENIYADYNTKQKPKSGFLPRVHYALGRLKNNSYPHDPSLDIPFRALIPILMCVVVYTSCRAFIIIEGFINLRALPPRTYICVEWSDFLPHF